MNKKLIYLSMLLLLSSCTSTVINYDPLLRQVESHNVSTPADTVGVDEATVMGWEP